MLPRPGPAANHGVATPSSWSRRALFGLARRGQFPSPRLGPWVPTAFVGLLWVGGGSVRHLRRAVCVPCHPFPRPPQKSPPLKAASPKGTRRSLLEAPDTAPSSQSPEPPFFDGLRTCFNQSVVAMR